MTADGDGRPTNGNGRLTIQEAAAALAVPAPTIRSWERRYGVPTADRSSGGHRRYAQDQLEQLRWMRDLIAQGRRPADAAALVASGHGSSAGSLVAEFLRAAGDLDPLGITRALEAANETVGLDRTVDEVLLPAMREVGEWWHAGRIDVAQEHLASNATRAWLAALAPAQPARPGPPVLLCCGPSDQHTLGLEALGALLHDRGWDCRLLGARTPGPSLPGAIAVTGAVAVVLASQLGAGRAAAVDALRHAERPGVHLFYAGGAFASARARKDVPGRYLGTNLARAADLVTDTITGTEADRPA